MRFRRTLSSLLFIAAIIAGGLWAVSAIRAGRRTTELVAPRGAGPLPVAVRRLAGEDAVVTVEVYGTLLPAREARPALEVGGRLLRVHPGWRPGALVRAGEELLAVDPRLFELEVRAAESRLAEAQAAQRGAELRARELADQLALAEERHAISLRELERLRDLRTDGIESESRLDAARMSSTAADLELRRTRESLGVSVVDVERADALLLQAEVALELAREHLERTVLRAPFDAWFTDRPPGPGTYVAPGLALGELIDVSTLHLQAHVPEGELAGLRVGLPAEVRLPARPELLLAGTVRAVGVRADPALRALAVEIEVPNVPGSVGAELRVDENGASTGRWALAAGQFARAVIEVRPLADVLVLERNEFRRERGAPIAFVVVDVGARAHLELRELRLGRRVRRAGEAGQGFAVLGGLAPGDVLATAPLDRLRDGLECEVRAVRGDAP